MKNYYFVLLFLPFLGYTQGEYILEKNFDPGTGFTEFSSPLLYDLYVQNDGKYLVGGSFTFYDGNAGGNSDLIRINSNGAKDITFTTPIEIDANVTALGEQSTNKVIVAYGLKIARLDDDGTWTNDLFVTNSFTTYSMIVLSDDKIIAAGNGDDGDIGIIKLNSDGSTDTNFVPGSGFTKRAGGFLFEIKDLAIQTDGKILVAGEFASYNGTTEENLIRLNADGSIDNTFDYTFDLGPKGWVEEVEIQSDDKIVISAHYRDNSSVNKHIIQRLTSTGVVDDINIDRGSGTGSDGGLKIDANDDIIVSSNNGTSTILKIDGSTGSLGYINQGIANNGFSSLLSDYVYDFEFDSNGDLMVIGDMKNFDGFPVPGIMKLTNCNSIDVSVESEDSQICTGETSTLTVQATGTGTVTYQWQVKANDLGATNTFTDLADGGVISGTTSNTLTFTNVTTNEGDKIYRCVVTDDNCVATSKAAVLTVLTAPQITSQPNSTVSACVGEQKVIGSVTSTGGNPNEVKWQVDEGSGFVDITDGSIYTAFNGNNLSLTSPTIEQSGNKYRWIMYSCATDLISDEVTLTVGNPPTITTEPENVTICVSGDASFSVAATGTETLTYQWQYYIGSNNYTDLSNSAVYSGVDSQTLTLTGATNSLPEKTLDGDFLFRCKVTDANGCVTYSGIGWLYFITTPEITTQPVDASYCLTDGVTQTHTFNPIITSQAGMVYQWQVDTGTGTFTDLTDNFTYSNTDKLSMTINEVHTLNNGNKYRLKLGNCDPLTYSDEVTVTATNKFSILALDNQSICVGSDAEFTGQVIIAEGMQPTYQWTALNSSNNTYEDLTDNTLYSGTQTLTLKVTGAPQSLDQQRYRLVVSAGACEVKSSIPSLRVYSTPSFQNQPTDKTTCEGTDVEINSFVNNLNTNVFSYQWQVDPGTGSFVDINDNLNYVGYNSSSLTILSPTADKNSYKYRNVIKGCVEDVISDEAILTVEQKPSFTTHPEEVTICLGEEASFSVETTGEIAQYLWESSSDGINFSTTSIGSGFNTSILTIPAVLSDYNGLYIRCRVQSSSVCGLEFSYSEPAILTVQQTTISVQPELFNIELCESTSTDISITALGENLTYQWLANDIALTDDNTYSGVTTNNLTISNATIDISGIVYKCRVNGDCEEVTSNQASLTVFETPKPVIIGNFNNPSAPSLAVEDPKLAYNWYKDDNLIQSNSAVINITSEGVYKVQGTINGNNVSCESEFSDDYSIIITDIEPLNTRQLDIYPNPVAKSLLIKGIVDINATFNLFSSSGKLVHSGPVKLLLEGLDVSDLRSGQYILKVNEKSKIRAFTIIKN